MIVDAQIHIWGANCSDRPWPCVSADGRAALAQREIPMTAVEALAEMNAASVERALLIPPSWEGERNDLAIAAAATHPDRFAVMGRVPDALRSLAGWRDQPGMMGARIMLGAEDVDHWLWAEAASRNIPLMVAPAGKVPLLASIARHYPELRLIVDHMGARVHQTGAAAFAQIEQVMAMAALPNVAIKASCLPDYSAAGYPWPDVTPFLRRLFDAYGAQRLFWGSDLSRLPCSYSVLVHFFSNDLPWLKGQERDLVMGQGILRWLDWK